MFEAGMLQPDKEAERGVPNVATFGRASTGGPGLQGGGLCNANVAQPDIPHDSHRRRWESRSVDAEGGGAEPA